MLGLDPVTLAPLKPRRWLWMAAQTCSSYREPLTSEALVEVLTTGAIPPAAVPTILHFLEEAPLQIVVMAVQQASQESGVAIDRVESDPLKPEQRLGVLRSNDRNLVLAAAGTGKTSVIVAKALDLIDRGLARPEEILVLAYNRAAAEELWIRLAEAAIRSDIPLDLAPQISTFHALGRQLLREAKVSTYMSVFTDDEVKLKQWVTSWVEGYLASDGRKLLKFISLFPQLRIPVNVTADSGLS